MRKQTHREIEMAELLHAFHDTGEELYAADLRERALIEQVLREARIDLVSLLTREGQAEWRRLHEEAENARHAWFNLMRYLIDDYTGEVSVIRRTR